MHYRLAGTQFGEITDQCIGVDRPSAVLTATRHAFTKQIAFTNQRQLFIRIQKTTFARADHDVTTGDIGFFNPGDKRRHQLDACQQILKRFAAAFTFYREYQAAGKGFIKATQVIHRRFILRLNG
ncbi:hypothetical protein SRABI106_02965 [Rahnella aquatilis]|nr:hypothetical protein SRABI106_02965 [Rahnella aquatilis]